jgi:putative alpha-1,2-mannosidase
MIWPTTRTDLWCAVSELSVDETNNIWSQNYRNVWDPTVKSDNFTGKFVIGNDAPFLLITVGTQGFMQKRYASGKFNFTDPTHCSPVDNITTECSLQEDNTNGFYESSSWEYSWFVVLYTLQAIPFICRIL